MVKVLITGVSGFIGYHTAKKLLEKGQQIIGIDNVNNSYDISLKEYRLSKLKHFQNFVFYKQDITNLEELKKIFFRNKIEKIIHLAGKAGVRKSLEEPQEYISSNILGTVNLLELSKDYKISSFINASSSSVYAKNELPFVENNRINKISSPYGVTKRATELFTYSYHLNYKLNIVNLRFFTVYGSIGRPDMSIFKFIKLIDNNEPIHIFGNGEQTRSFTFVDDIVNGIIKALELTGFETINLGNDKRYSLNYLIKAIEKRLNKKAKLIFEETNSLDMQDTLPDIQKANKLLNWKPEIDLDEGISKTVNWHIENKDLVNSICFNTQIKIYIIIATSKKRTDLLINRSLKSIYTQKNTNFENVEIVIVDDNVKESEYSTEYEKIENSIKELKKKCKLNKNQFKTHLLTNKKTQFQSGTGAWNTGIEFIKKQSQNKRSFTAILDDDDKYNESYLHECVEQINDKTIAVFAPIIWKEQTFERIHTIKKEELTSKHFFIGNPGVQGSNMFFRSDILEKIGGFDENLPSTTDRDLMIRFLDYAKQYPKNSISILKEPLVIHYATGNDRVTDDKIIKKNGLDIFYKKYKSRFSETDFQKSINRAKQFFQYEYAEK